MLGWFYDDVDDDDDKVFGLSRSIMADVVVGCKRFGWRCILKEWIDSSNRKRWCTREEGLWKQLDMLRYHAQQVERHLEDLLRPDTWPKTPSESHQIADRGSSDIRHSIHVAFRISSEATAFTCAPKFQRHPPATPVTCESPAHHRHPPSVGPQCPDAPPTRMSHMPRPGES